MSFPAYPNYKDSGVSWLGEVPSHWEVLPLKRRYSVTLGKMLQPDARNDTDVERCYLRAANIKWGQVDLADVKTMWFSAAETAALTLRHGDLLVSEGGDVGRSAIWRSELADCHFQNSVNRVRPIGDASTKLLFYWMATIKAKGYVDVLCNKSTIAHFTTEKVRAVPTPIPAASEQEAIAAFLDRETAKIDTLVAEQERLIALLKEKRQAVISHAVTKGLNPHAPMKDSGIEWLGEIPAHWEVGKLFYGARLQSGYAFSSSDFGSEGVPVVRMNNLNRGKLDLSEAVRISDTVCNPAVALCPGDLVWGMSGSIGDTGSLGNFAVVVEQDIPCQLNQRVGRFLINKNRMAPEFLQIWIQSQPFYLQIMLAVTGTAQFNVSAEQVQSTMAAFPPLDEQQLIVEYITGECLRFASIIDEAQAAITLLQERRAALISAAVTGKIDVRGLVDQNEMEAA